MADNPIDIKKLFNFDDTTPLDEVIVKIQQLNVFYDALVASAQKGAASVTSSMQVMQKSIDALEQEMVQADATTKKGQETITNGAAVTSKAVAQNEEYKKSITELNATIKVLQDQIDKLSESNKKIPKDNELASGSLADLKIKLKDATDAYIKMGDATDAAIKQKALKNITDLNTAVKNGQQIVNDAKKATDIAAGSYNDLALKVANATKQLKAMEGGVGSNSEQFKALQKTINDGNTKLKEFDAAIGVSTRNVGGYTEGIEKAIPALRAISPAAVEAGEAVKGLSAKFITLLANPVVAIIAGIIGGFALLKKSWDIYTEDTIQGADKTKQFGLAWGAVTEMVTARFKVLGKQVFDFVNDSGFAQYLAQTTAYLIGGAAGVAEYNTRLSENNEILQMQLDLRKEEIGLIESVSSLELEKEKETHDAREKEGRSLQERYEAVGRVNEIRKEEVALKLKSAQAEVDIQEAYFKKIGVIITDETKMKDLFENEIVIQKKSYEQVEALAKARAKLTSIKREEFEGTRRIQALEIQLLNEQQQHIIAGIKQEKDARDKLNLELITSDQQSNARVLSNQSSTLNEKIDAEMRNLDDAKQLNDKALADELFAFREQALSKVVLDKATNDKLIIQAGDNLKVRAQLILDAKNEALNSDEAFSSQEQAITEANGLKVQELIKKSGDNIVKITQETHKRMAEAEGATTSESKDAALIALEKSFANREISFLAYETKKKGIETQGKIDELEIQNDQLNADLAYFTSSEELAKKHADEILQIRKKLAANEEQIGALSNTKKLEQDKKIYALEKQLANEALDAITVIADNATQAKLNALDAQLSSLQSHHDKDLQLADNSATVKAQIEANFTKEQAKIQKEQNKLKHDQAIRDKQLAEAKIFMNTLIAASEALASGPPPGDIILAALVTAIGLAQEAKVASTPIPAYFKGTDYSKEGFAQVAEQGRELAIDRSGDIALYNKPQIAYLNEGTKIFTNAQTEPIMEKMGTKHMDLVSHQLIDIGIRDLKAGQAISVETIGHLKELKDITKRNKPVQVNYAKVGAIVYEFKREEETYVKRIKALSMGAWMK